MPLLGKKVLSSLLFGVLLALLLCVEFSQGKFWKRDDGTATHEAEEGAKKTKFNEQLLAFASTNKTHSAKDQANRVGTVITFSGISAKKLAKWLEERGAFVVTQGQGYLEAFVPSGLLDAIDEHPNVVSAWDLDPPERNGVNSPMTTSIYNNVKKSMLLSTSSQRLNYRGTGVKVGVISDSANCIGGGIATSMDSANLPYGNTRNVVLQDNCHSGSTDEARAMAEIIFDIAEGSNFYYYAPRTSLDMANGVMKLASSGCKVIVDDLGWASEPWFKVGSISAKITDVVKKYGVTYLTAAGNAAASSFGTAKFDGYFTTLMTPSGSTRKYVCHRFPNGNKWIPFNTAAKFKIWAQWDDWWKTGHYQETNPNGAHFDMDLLVLKPTSTYPQIVSAHSDTTGDKGGDPWAATSYPGGKYYVAFCNYDNTDETAADGSLFKIVFLTSAPLGHSWINGPTAVGHANTYEALTVGAMDYWKSCRSTWASDPNCASGAYPVMSSFSSKGGHSVLYDRYGLEYATPKRYMKPDIVGHQCGETSFFGWPNENSYGNIVSYEFCGTSAAAPAVAGLAVLLREQCPYATWSDFWHIIRRSGVDVKTPPAAVGFDYWSGYGHVNGTKAMHARCIP